MIRTKQQRLEGRTAPRKARIWTALALALAIAIPPLGWTEQKASADAPSWSTTLFSYDFEQDALGGPPAVQASNPDTWNASASSEQSTLTIVSSEGGKALQFERVSGSVGSGGPRVEKRLATSADTMVRVDFRVKTGGNRFDFELRSTDNNAPASTRMLYLTGPGLIPSPPSGLSLSGSQMVNATVIIDFGSRTYETALNGVTIASAQPLNEDLVVGGPLNFRFSSILQPGQRLTLDDVLIRTNNTPPGVPVIEHLLDEHPRLMATAADFDRIRLQIPTDTLMQGWYNTLKNQADAMLTQPVSEYGFPDGRTLLQISRQVLSRANTLAFVYQISQDTRYAERLWDELEAAAAFPDWNPVSFLSTAEMTNAFAIGYDWLYQYWSPTRRAALENAIINMGLTPGIQGYYDSAWWATTNNNWNIVTNSGLGIGALAVGDKAPELADEILRRSMNNLPIAIAEYAPDGAYPEGVGYWAYATSYLVPYIAALETALGDDYGLADLPGLSDTGKYPIYMSGSSGTTFNYYDSSIGRQNIGDLLWLGQRHNEPTYGWWTLQGSGATPRYLLWYDPSKIESPISAGLPLDASFRGSEVVTMRSAWQTPDALFVGFKGGLNGENHGDLDLGTFVLDAFGQRWAEELGQENYGLPGYWSDGPNGQRWTYYRKRAEGQNTLVVQPGAGPDQDVPAEGEIVRYESGATEAFAIADLSAAYASRGVTDWQRGVKLLDNRSQILIQDELTASDPVESWWFMHTRADIEIGPDGRSALLKIGNERMLARIVSPDPDPVFTVMDAVPLWSSPNPAGQTANSSLRKLTVQLDAANQAALSVLFTPVRDGIPTAAAPAFQPLNAWGIPTQPTAQLTNLLIDGQPLASFVPGVYQYEQRPPAGTPVSAVPPVVAASAAAAASVTVEQATYVPGKAVITVTQASYTPARYEVYFRGGHPDHEKVKASIIGTYPPSHTIDGKLNTFFSAQGHGQWVQYDLGQTRPVDGVELAWYQGNVRSFSFKVLGSVDGTQWTELYSGSGAGDRLDLEAHSFAASPARYVRIVGYGNTSNDWMSVTEARIRYSGQAWPDLVPTWTHLDRLILQASASLVQGATLPLSVQGVNYDGTPGNLSALDIAYVSSNTAVATVNANGVVQAVGPGTAKISAYAVTQQGKWVHASTAVTVTAASP
ncbi:hypothetical protein FE784_31655 [Paenibacillus hemerocallicola]|uniref:F5/8 type C domain-containing protein n=1 Tax=Paenibacillus hemerocallicola TaxID=1172614 RepID=A0A5C4SZM0_9BACL|nr:discoidin domain-containing protein [Paenibacillus hemerocallicola]TNJ62242.1 hypothetical protein FE784_31655 [Paenibacillus hemerocallicola]